MIKNNLMFVFMSWMSFNSISYFYSFPDFVSGCVTGEKKVKYPCGCLTMPLLKFC